VCRRVSVEVMENTVQYALEFRKVLMVDVLEYFVEV
jgi:hypothetical protein